MQVFSYVFHVLIDFCLLLSKSTNFQNSKDKTVSGHAHKCFENGCWKLKLQSIKNKMTTLHLNKMYIKKYINSAGIYIIPICWLNDCK